MSSWPRGWSPIQSGRRISFDVGDYRLKPHHYDQLLELGAQVVNNASSAGGLALLIDGHADDSGAPFMNIGLSFNRALESSRSSVKLSATNHKDKFKRR